MIVPGYILRITRVTANTFCFLGKLLGVLSVLPYLLPVHNFENENSVLWDCGEYIDAEYKLNLAAADYIPRDSARAAVLLIHGFSGSSFSFRKNLPALHDSGYFCRTIDLPGFGNASKGPGFDYSDTTRNKAIVKALNKPALNVFAQNKQIYSTAPADGKWILVGHSMGAGICLEIASLVPDKIKGIVLIDGFSAISANSNKGNGTRWFYYPPLGRWADVLATNFIFKHSVFKKLLSSAYGQTPADEDVHGYLNPFKKPYSASSVFRMAAGQGNSQLVKNNIKNIPILLIWGEKDEWIPISNTRLFMQEYPDARMVTIKNAGHCPMETHAARVNKEILNFIQSTSKP